MNAYLNEINTKTGLLEGVQYLPSPHQDHRPSPEDVSLVVIHNISLPPGQFDNGFVQSFFLGELDIKKHDYFQTISGLRVSSHLFIDRRGVMTQFVPFHQRAWHAGESSFERRERCNDYSIGIELEGTDDLPYEAVQYVQLASVIQMLMQVYKKVTKDRVVGHVDIAPLRKTDPGASFDWVHLKGMLP